MPSGAATRCSCSLSPKRVAMSRLPSTRHPRHSAQVDVPLKPRLYRHPHGICAVDAEYLYPGHAAAHIIEDGGRAAFVDVGTNNSVPYLLAALAELGIARTAVDYVLLTHVHLDHAGGAGRPIAELPQPLVGLPSPRA